MKYQHIQWISKSPFFVNFKKHYCPECHEYLKKIKVSRIVNSNSPEAANFDFHTLDNFMVGNVKFIWIEFKCPNCNKQYTIDEVKKMETNNEKKNSN
jgi:predicted RNA-binding Zn-ribbon protein involved in translation (DUF1610 family)